MVKNDIDIDIVRYIVKSDTFYIKNKYNVDIDDVYLYEDKIVASVKFNYINPIGNNDKGTYISSYLVEVNSYLSIIRNNRINQLLKDS